MSDYLGVKYNGLKSWVLKKYESRKSWDDIARLTSEEFEDLRDEEMIVPSNMDFDEWPDFVRAVKERYKPFSIVTGISGEPVDNLPVPSERGSAWVGYKNLLLGTYTGNPRMSEPAVGEIEGNCNWILGRLKRDTRSTGPVKGLVMGSVQSGKTANMIGLVSMAADYDWNIFIVLSGTIENLRRQTLGRFERDLSSAGGLSWYFLDYSRDTNFMNDSNGKTYSLRDLDLNAYPCTSRSSAWKDRYVIVCLKNSKRLQNLITWLHSSSNRSSKMRILVMDDEADQASINTRKMADEDEIERTKVNELIINLVTGRDGEGNRNETRFQALNYVCYTATPYANVLNEAGEESLYPGGFVCSLPESDEYFGPKAIMGSRNDERFNGLDVVRTIPDEDVERLDANRKRGRLNSVPALSAVGLPEGMKRSVCWFLCAAAVLRLRGYKKPVSMLIHTTPRQDGHFDEYDALKKWLETEGNAVVELCEEVYIDEKDKFRLDDLRAGYPDYAKMDEVCDDYPDFAEIRGDVATLAGNVVNIRMVDDGRLGYDENAVHLCVDNCRANRIGEDGSHLRIVYPSGEDLERMNKAPVFVVMGGNTLSRGLTLEGLVCTYFARNVNQADTLMQMARWFGYRRGYELLQRIWLPDGVREKFELVEEIDEKLKEELRDFMDKGKKPSEFGPRIMTASKIAGFMLTSKTKSQNAEPCDFDFTGDRYETTQFENSKMDLKNNIRVAEEFLCGLGRAEKSDTVPNAFVWRDVDSKAVFSRFFDAFEISERSSLRTLIPGYLKEWMGEMNEDGRFLKWDVAVAGSDRSNARWTIGDTGADVGKIVRSKKKSRGYIDIGSLRSGSDIMCDVDKSKLTARQKKVLEDGMRTKAGLTSLRYELGLGDKPLLLLYRIDKDGGRDMTHREPIGSFEDVIGFSVIISGQRAAGDCVRAVRVKLSDEER